MENKRFTFMSKILSFFEKHFDKILHFIEVMLIGFFGVYISIQANSIARSQLDLSKAISMPAIYVIEEEVFNSEGVVDTRTLNVYNENGYMTNYRSEKFSDLIITTSSDFQRYDLRIPLEGLWSVGLHTGKMIGLIETRGYNKNYEKYKTIISDAETIFASDKNDADYFLCNAETIFASDKNDADYFLCNAETYVKITFLDVQHKEQSLYFKLDPIMGTIMVEQTEYELLLNQHNLNKNNYYIDIYKSTGDELIRIVNSLVQKDT